MIERLGEPDYVFDPGFAMDNSEADGRPGHIETFRSLLFYKHSETAVIRAEIQHTGMAAISFFPKGIDEAGR